MMTRNKLRLALIVELLSIVLSPCAHSESKKAGEHAGKERFVLSSADLQPSRQFTDDYVLNGFGCTGGNHSPPLAWHGAPAGTRSFVLTLFDRDEHGTPSGWWHWVVYDIPGSTTTLARDAGVAHSPSLPAPALHGRSDLGTMEYHGPCPAKGDAPHRYTFTLYALDVDHLDVPPESSGAMVVLSTADHLLGKTSLVIRHGR